ncbi:Voltage-dependent anion-selective channel protein 1 [Sarracenia purpurea var. burkii]
MNLMTELQLEVRFGGDWSPPPTVKETGTLGASPNCVGSTIFAWLCKDKHKQGLLQTPSSTSQVWWGTNVAALGIDVSFNSKTWNFTNCNAGLSFANADLVASLTLCLQVVEFCPQSIFQWLCVGSLLSACHIVVFCCGIAAAVAYFRSWGSRSDLLSLLLKMLLLLGVVPSLGGMWVFGVGSVAGCAAYG